MSFSDNIPEKLKEYPTVTSFINVLDALQSYKDEIISSSIRVNNAALLMDKKWLIKKLGDFGVTIPIDYPIQIIQQYLLNVDTVCRTRGSKIGLELYCSLLSLGEVTVNDDLFYKDQEVLMLDSISSGYITQDNKNLFFHIVDDNDILNLETQLSIDVKSKFFNGQYPNEESLIKSYLKSTIQDNITFSNTDVEFNWGSRDDFYFHKLLNPYFV